MSQSPASKSEFRSLESQP